MKHHNQTVFYIEHMHPGWLSTRQLQRAYRRCAIQLPGMLIGMLVTLVLSPFLLSMRSGLDTIILGFIGGIAGRGLLSGSHPIRVLGEGKIESSRSKRYHSITPENLKVGMRMGLIYGLCLSLIMLLVTGGADLINSLVFGKPIYVTLGTVLFQVTVLFTEPTKFFLMVMCIILVGRNRSIQPAEIVSWSWGSLWQSLIDARHVRNTLLIGLIVGLFNGVISGLVEGLVEGVTNHGLSIGLATLWIELNVELKSGLVTLLQTGLAIGLSYWLLLGLFSGISSNILDEQSRIVPNQGIRRSARNSLLFGLISGLVSGFSYTLIYIIPVLYTFRDHLSEPWMRGELSGMLNSELIIVIAGGLLAGLLMGGLACLQHCILRFLLWRAGSIPWNYPYFLDYADERTLLRKVGGGYIFVHRLLLEYFASLDTTPSPDTAKAQKQQTPPVS